MMAGGIILSIITLIWGNMTCSVFGIGNRSYSMYCESHFLVKKKGVLKILYFRPKHFGCFSLFEIVEFFFSYIAFIVDATLLVMLLNNTIAVNIFLTVAISLCGCIVFIHILWVAINDITQHREEKQFTKNDRGMSWITFYSQVHFYYDNNKKRENVSEKCKQFFKNHSYAQLERVENNKTYAVISIDSPSFKDKIYLNY